MIRSAAEVLAEYREYARHPDPRIQLGLPGLDDEFRGISPGELLVFIARSGVGKTNWWCNVAVNNLDVPQVFFSLEMKATLILARCVAIHYDLPYRQLEEAIRREDPVVIACFDEAAERFSRIVVVDRVGLDIEAMKTYVDVASEHLGAPVKLVGVDYLELVRTSGADRNSPATSVAQAAEALKDLSKELDLAVIALHQVGREAGGAGGRPLEMSSARYGGETQADYLLGAYRPGLDRDLDEGARYVLRHRVILQVLKSREGFGSRTEFSYDLDPDTVRYRLPADAPADQEGRGFRPPSLSPRSSW